MILNGRMVGEICTISPESIPIGFVQPHAKLGILHGHSQLAPDGGVNNGLNNALYEGGERNGVLTAVENFLQQTPWYVSFHQALSNSGLGIIAPKHESIDRHIQNVLAASGL